MKATKVDGIYNADPILHPDASRYDRISYLQVLEQGLGGGLQFRIDCGHHVIVTPFPAGVEIQ